MSGTSWRRIAATAAAAVGVVVLTACGSAAPGPSGTAATSGPPLAGGGPATTAPATTKPAPTFPADAAGYTKAAVAAWAAGDVSTLDQYEDSGGELHTMLSCTGCYNKAFALSRCEGAAGSSYCRFFNDVGDDLLLRVNNSLLGQPRALGTGSTLDPISFPSDNEAYAEKALNAWLNDNDPRLKLLTAKPFTAAQITALGANHATGWTFDHSEGAAGSSYYDFKDGAGHMLAFRFLNGPAAPTTGPASQHRITDIVYLG